MVMDIQAECHFCSYSRCIYCWELEAALLVAERSSIPRFSNNKQQKLTSVVTQTDYFTFFMIVCHYHAYKFSLQMFNVGDQNINFAYKGFAMDTENLSTFGKQTS